MRRSVRAGLGIALVAVVCGAMAAMALWGGSKTGSAPEPPSLVFLGADGSAPFGMAAFAVHNPSSRGIFLHRAEVQVLEEGTWRTEADDAVQVVHPQWPHFKSTTLCEAGTGCIVTTPWPKSGPWRVRIVFQAESRSARWVQRAWKVVRFRDLGFWKARLWEDFQVAEGPLIFDGPDNESPELTSVPVSVSWDAPRLPTVQVIPMPAPVSSARTNPSPPPIRPGGEDPLHQR